MAPNGIKTIFFSQFSPFPVVLPLDKSRFGTDVEGEY